MATEIPSVETGDWSDKENDLIVSDYLEMLHLELSGQPYGKSQRNADLQRRTGRSRGAIEFKHMNISAALEWLGFPRIAGYAPLQNLQKSLIDAIERNYESVATIAGRIERPDVHELSEGPLLSMVDAPLKTSFDQIEDGEIERLVRKFDPAERDFRNRQLGRQGEQIVFLNERFRLLEANSPFANSVRWVSEEDGDGAGFDILSFDLIGQERRIEVKTTIGGQGTPFYISRNELEVSSKYGDSFRLVRVFDFSIAPKAFELVPPLDSVVRLEPSNYLASFR